MLHNYFNNFICQVMCLRTALLHNSNHFRNERKNYLYFLTNIYIQKSISWLCSTFKSTVKHYQEFLCIYRIALAAILFCSVCCIIPLILSSSYVKSVKITFQSRGYFFNNDYSFNTSNWISLSLPSISLL